MKGYNLVKEGPKHFEIQHADKSIFKVAKSGLDSSHMAKIRKLPVIKMSDGGEVPEEEDGAEEAPAMPEAPQALGVPELVSQDEKTFNVKMPEGGFQTFNKDFSDPNVQNLYNQAMQNTERYSVKPDDTPKENAPIESPPPSAQASVNPNTAAPSQAGVMQNTGYAQNGQPLAPYQDEYSRNIDKTLETIRKGGDVAQQEARNQAKIYQDQSTQLKTLYDNAQAENKALDDERAKLTKDVADNKIDPTRVWSNASTGNKILAGIGVLLSGAGSGLSGGPNLALQVINKTIDQDIDAQKAELGKKENLLSMNLRKYGNLQAATAATALHLNAVTQGQIMASASRASGAQAQTNAQLAMNQLNAQAAQWQQGLAIWNMKNSMLSGGGNGGSDFSPAQIEAAGLTPRAVNIKVDAPGPPGRSRLITRIAQTPEDAKILKDALPNLDSIESLTKKMISSARDNGTTIWGSSQDQINQSDRSQLIQTLGQLDQLKRLTGEEVKLREMQVPDPGAVWSSKSIAQFVNIRKYIEDVKSSLLTSHLNAGASPMAPEGAGGMRLTSTPLRP